MSSSIEELPKLEVHAHLNGSISRTTIKRLLDLKVTQGREQPPNQALTCIADTQSRGNKQIFEMFDLIHQITDSIEAAYIITCDVIRDFASDGVKYLELRTTPREVPQTGMTKRSYIETVLRGIQDSLQNNLDIMVNLILAIDRTKSLAVAMETVDLALEYRETSGGVIVGIDLSGNPQVGDASLFIPALLKAKNAGFKLSVHLSEAAGKNSETERILEEVVPHRIGHAVYLRPDAGGSQAAEDLVTKHRIPIEICMTSNLKCQLVESYAQHPFGFWKSTHHPYIICTDDKGVFDTSLSREYRHASETFGLSLADLWTMGYNGIDYIFADDDVKARLKQKWRLANPTPT